MFSGYFKGKLQREGGDPEAHVVVQSLAAVWLSAQPVNCCTPDFRPSLSPGFAQTHFHCVGDAI